MARAPVQVLVLPFRRAETLRYAVFSRRDDLTWQGIAGGGEGIETPLQAARREAWEEGGITADCEFVTLQARASVPVSCFPDTGHWGDELYVIPEHAFGVDLTGRDVVLSSEHDLVRWAPYAEALALLHYDSNRTALWELNRRLLGQGPRDA
ncbi:TPA: NUDIX domain-containing protein [Pseudomonas aeruginosa]|nr:NUDIX domain-containing protein [Pseudomonas aeruginosa]